MDLFPLLIVTIALAAGFCLGRAIGGDAQNHLLDLIHAQNAQIAELELELSAWEEGLAKAKADLVKWYGEEAAMQLDRAMANIEAGQSECGNFDQRRVA